MHNWIMTPAVNAINYLTDEVRYSGTLKRSLASIVGMRPFFIITKDFLLKHGQSTKEIDLLISESPDNEIDGKRLAENDFEIINIHSTVNLWSPIEVAVEDTVSLILKNSEDSFHKIGSAGLNINKKYSWPLDHEELPRLFSSLLVQSRAGKNVGEAYAYLLEVLGLELDISTRNLHLVSELASVRNCILHRGGIVDEKASQVSDYLQEHLGGKVPISSSKYLEYYDAAAKFILSLLNASMKSEYFKTDQQAINELQVNLSPIRD